MPTAGIPGAVEGRTSVNSSAAWEFIESNYSEDPDHPYVVVCIVRGHGHIPGGIAQLRDVKDVQGNDWMKLTNNITVPIRRPSVFTCTSSPEGLASAGCIEDCYAEFNFDSNHGWQVTPRIIQYHVPKKFRASKPTFT